MALAERIGAVPAARSRHSDWFQRKSVRSAIHKWLVFIILTAGALLFIAPVIWMLVTALKPNQLVFDGRLIPTTAEWSNFYNAWKEAPFALYARNTLVIAALSTTGTVISSSLVAYAFARLRFPGKNFLFGLLLATMLLPGIVTFIPQYILWSKLGYVNTYVPLTVPAWFGSSFFIFLLRQFYRGIPQELSDAARMDGAGEVRIWWQIIMPLARPALTAVAIFAFTGAWEDYFNPLIYLNTESKFNLQIGLQVFEDSQGGIPQWNYLMAVGLVIMLPVILFYFFGQRYFIEGVTLSGIAGR